jgi:hypothetical protein
MTRKVNASIYVALITIKVSSAVRQAHGPEQGRRAALPSIAPPLAFAGQACGV